MNIRGLRPEDLVVHRERGYDYGPFPPLYYAAHWMSDRAEKLFGWKLKVALNASLGSYHKGRSRWILGMKADWDILADKIFTKVLEDKSFLRKTNRIGARTGRKLLLFSRMLLKEAGRSYSIPKLIASHGKLVRLYEEYGLWNTLLWLALTDKLMLYVSSTLETHGLNNEEIQTLCTPVTPTYAFEEERQLLKIAVFADFNAKRLEKQPLGVQQALARHAKRWYWMPYEYIGPTVWTERDFLRRIFSLVDGGASPEEALKEKVRYHRSLQIAQAKLVKRYDVPREVQRLIRDLRLVATMQDEKKYNCSIAQYALQTAIFRRMGEALHLQNFQDCMKFTEKELKAALESGDVKLLRTKLSERLRAVTAVMTATGTRIVAGREAGEFYTKFDPEVSRITTIKGRSASAGIARGSAKVLRSAKEIHKVKKGDILVTSMTTPDYVPIMRLAAAIVTNEGGLTSHAAIVSRELGIPCIVGTKIATEVLKDGMTVEVDAQRGMVTILP